MLRAAELYLKENIDDKIVIRKWRDIIIIINTHNKYYEQAREVEE